MIGCQPDKIQEDKLKEGYKPSFKTRADTELFFKNVRQIYYTKETPKDSKIDLYRFNEFSQNPNKPSIYPFVITSADFEADGVSYNNPNIVGDNLELFPNQLNQQFWYAGQGLFVYTSTGIRITYAGFDANTQDWTIRIDQVFGNGIPPVVSTNDLIINSTD